MFLHYLELAGAVPLPVSILSTSRVPFGVAAASNRSVADRCILLNTKDSHDARQLRCLVVRIGISSFQRRNDRCDPGKGVVGVGVGIEVCGALFVSDATEAIGRVVGEVRGGHRAGCTRALVPSDLGALIECVVRESHMFRENRMPTGLTLLDDIGQTLQLVVLEGVLEVQSRRNRGLELRSIVHRIERLIEGHRGCELVDRLSNRGRSAKIVQGEVDRRRRIGDGCNLAGRIVGRGDGSHR